MLPAGHAEHVPRPSVTARTLLAGHAGLAPWPANTRCLLDMPGALRKECSKCARDRSDGFGRQGGTLRDVSRQTFSLVGKQGVEKGEAECLKTLKTVQS